MGMMNVIPLYFSYKYIRSINLKGIKSTLIITILNTHFKYLATKYNQNSTTMITLIYIV